MSIRGHCRCRNIEVHWQLVDYSLVPRRCQCEYCLARDAAYVSKAGSRVDITIHKPALHEIHQQGSMSASFHECGHCHDLVLVTAEIDGELFGALNANCLHNPRGFGESVAMTLYDQSAEQKIARWRQNWCHPVFIHLAEQEATVQE